MRRQNLLAIFPYHGIEEALLKRAALPAMGAIDAARENNRKRLAAFYAGRAALATAFQYAGIDAEVRADPEHGFLHVVNRKGEPIRGLHANVSHADSLAVAVVTPVPAGVDTEALDRDVTKAADRFLSAEERRPAAARFRLGGSEVPGALALWCAKEAYAKGVGKGIGIGLADIRVALSGEPPYRVDGAPRGPLPLVTPAVAFEVHAGHLIAICTERESLETGFHRLTVKIG